MYCGLDIGTSSVKCALVDESGIRAGYGRASVGLYRGGPGAYVSDPGEWLRAVAAAYADAAEEANRSGRGGALRAVAVSGNGPTLVPMGPDGKPAGRAVSWMDRGAVDQARRVSELSGRPIDASFYLPKVLKLVEEGMKPAGFFSGPEYVAHAMGADPVSYLVDPFYEPFTWNLDAAAALGLPRSWFPPYVEPARVIGAVSARASEAYGLPAGIPIVSAFPDFIAALVGSGAMRPGLACDRSGSSEALNLCAVAPYPDAGILSLPHPVKGLWNLSGGLSTSGKALEWFSAAAGYSGLDADGIYQDAQAAAPGAGGILFLPYLSGERAPLWNPSLRGAFLGLSLEHGRRDMARAVLESLGYGLRLAADRMRAGGFPLDLVRCSGGAARDSVLCSLKADVLRVPVEVPEMPDCEPVGDACACAVALGDHGDLAGASAVMARVRDRYEPDADSAAFYDGRYAAWNEALKAVASLGPCGPVPKG